jgi:hypothetical protein
MTDQSFPITPPTELVQQWLCSSDYLWGPLEQTSITITANRLQSIATQAAQWGADQEMEACCKSLYNRFESQQAQFLAQELRDWLRAARRLEEALEELERLRGDADSMGMGFDAPAIRAALEDLPND